MCVTGLATMECRQGPKCPRSPSQRPQSCSDLRPVLKTQSSSQLSESGSRGTKIWDWDSIDSPSRPLEDYYLLYRVLYELAHSFELLSMFLAKPGRHGACRGALVGQTVVLDIDGSLCLQRFWHLATTTSTHIKYTPHINST